MGALGVGAPRPRYSTLRRVCVQTLCLLSVCVSTFVMMRGRPEVRPSPTVFCYCCRCPWCGLAQTVTSPHHRAFSARFAEWLESVCSKILVVLLHLWLLPLVL